ncbi:MAG: NAD(P)H-dependent oxidoreductase [Alphaproteobacteria bacterium]
MANLKVIALNCSLKGSDKESSTGLLLAQIAKEFRKFGSSCKIVRVADLDIKPGVSSDEGDGDEWPGVRRGIVASDILVVGTPIWLGKPSSICQKVLERLDAFLGETDARHRMPSYGKIACVAVVGNEDGAHHVSAELYQALNDVGFTIPANAVSYWVGEAMGGTDYKDLEKTPKQVASATAMLVRNAVHLAGMLKADQYPGLPE